MNSLLPYMAKVGVGKTGARELTRDEADSAMTALLEGRYHPVTFGAFFMGLRFKGETPDELCGFLDAMSRKVMHPSRPAPPGLLDCAGAYDGKSRTCNIGIPAALITAAAGVPVIMHGARGIPTKFGMTTSHVLEALGVETLLPLDAVNECLHEIGIGYADQSVFLPALHALLPHRCEMGKRTILNTMEALANPFAAECHVGGFFHDPYAELVCRAIPSTRAPFCRTVMVKGIEGSDELRPGLMSIAMLAGAEYVMERVDSDALGFPAHISELSADSGSLEKRTQESAQCILQLFESPNEPSGFRNAVVLNAGVRIYASGRASSISEAVTLAADALHSGAAGERLARWRRAAAVNVAV